jgi:hypothetical protein
VATSNAAAERRLRLAAEALIADAASMAPDEALAALADVESGALALAGAGVLDGGVAMDLVVAVVDALAVRGVAWLEPVAADLDLARLHEAVGSSRPELRTVVGVGATLGTSGVVTSVSVWDDRTEARMVSLVDGAPDETLTIDAVAPGERRLDVRDGWGAMVGVDLARGVAGSAGEVSAVALDAASFLDGLADWVAGAAHRQAADVDALNRLRRRLVAAADALGVDAADRVARFDELVAGLAAPSWTAGHVEVVPLALRAGDRWLLAVERWDDHWRLELAGPTGRGRWAAATEDGLRFGGDVLAAGVVRFDPALPADWSALDVRWTPDGAAVTESVRVRR